MPTARQQSITLDGQTYWLFGPNGFRRMPMEQFVRAVGTGDKKYSDLSRWQVKAWDTWHLGKGQEYEEKVGKYWDSDHCWALTPKRLHLAPLRTRVGVGAGATDMAGNPIKFLLFNDNGTDTWYCFAGDSAYTWDATNNYWVLERDFNATVTDAQVYDNVLYVALGSTTAQEKTGGSWANVTNTWVAQLFTTGMNRAGQYVLYRTTNANRNQISYSSNGDTWSTAISIGDSATNITKMIFFKGELFLGKEDGLWVLGNDDRPYQAFNFQSLEHSGNFDAMAVWRRDQLFTDTLYGLWEYSGSQFREVGVEKGEGQRPQAKWGHYDMLLPLINMLAAAIDAGTADSRTSIVEAYNSFGWHEILQAGAANRQIEAIGFTPAGVIESESRLWYGDGLRAGYILLPDKSEGLYEYSGATYETAGQLTTSWFDAGLPSVTKDWGSVDIWVENVDYNGTAGESVEIHYQIDAASSFTSLTRFQASGGGTTVTNGYATVNFPSSTTGRRIRLRIDPDSSDGNETPLIRAVVLKYFVRPSRKYGFDLTLLLTEKGPLGTQHAIKWDTQIDNLLTTYEKDEPVTLAFTEGRQSRSYTVIVDPPIISWLASKDGSPEGAVVRVRCWES